MHHILNNQSVSIMVQEKEFIITISIRKWFIIPGLISIQQNAKPNKLVVHPHLQQGLLGTWSSPSSSLLTAISLPLNQSLDGSSTCWLWHWDFFYTSTMKQWIPNIQPCHSPSEMTHCQIMHHHPLLHHRSLLTTLKLHSTTFLSWISIIYAPSFL